jgi:hypothetical protein
MLTSRLPDPGADASWNLGRSDITTAAARDVGLAHAANRHKKPRVDKWLLMAVSVSRRLGGRS